MKRITFLIIAGFLLSMTGYTTNIQAYLSYAVFNTPDNKPYIETYLIVNGNTLHYISKGNGDFQGVLDVQLIFKQGDSIVNFGKYELAGPLIQDTSSGFLNILDVQRYSLPPGDYSIEFTINDQNSEQEAILSKDEFSIQFPESEMYFSDIEFLHSYTKSDEEDILIKSGYKLIPYVFNYYPEAVKELVFYTELYDSKKVVDDDQFILYYYIRPFEVDKKLDQFFYMKKMSGQTITPLLNSIDISLLPSGNYLFVLETRDRNNILLSKKETYFQRENENVELNLNNMLVADLSNTFVDKIDSRDSLVLYIDYLYPISTDMQKVFAKSLAESSDIETLQKYFLNFWVERDGFYPEEAWEAYHFLVKQTNHEFRSVTIAGYKTDRGRVYLQYGAPNGIAKSYNEPAAYPYEIWQYYDLNGQRDIKFVYVSRDVATNDFQLIHSNARGELSNYRWQVNIYQRTWDPYNLDEKVIPPSYGSFATDYYMQPR